MTAGEKVKAVRSAKEMTLIQFAKPLKVGKSLISMMESGEREVTERLEGDILRIYNVNPEWWKTGEGEMFILDNNRDMNSYRYVDPQAGNDARSGEPTITGEEEDLEARLLHREWVGMSPDQRLALIQAARKIRSGT